MKQAHAAYRIVDLYSRFSPTLAERTRRSLDRITAELARSQWPEVVWQFSRLNGDGYPIEFAFSSADSVLRYTAEVGPPEMAEDERLFHAARLCEELGGIPPAPQRIRAFCALQSRGALTFGTWIGARHTAAGDRYKLYIEVPGEGGLRMIGYEPATGLLERYYSVGRLRVDELGCLAKAAAVHGVQQDLIRAIFRVLDRPAGDELPGGHYGYSIAPNALSVFTFARIPFGSDAAIRRTLSHRLGPVYEAATEPIANASSLLTMHGMLSFIATPGRSVAIRIGLRPPDC